MAIQLLTQNDDKLIEVMLRLHSNPDFKLIMEEWRKRLADMHLEVCSRPDPSGREWYAGRASLLANFFRSYDAMTLQNGVRYRQVALSPEKF